MKFQLLFLFSAFSLTFLAGGCVVGYQPLTPMERSAFQQARFDIYPDDVRDNPDKYRGENIAWAGIIQESEFYEQNDRYEIVLLLEHRYFDWKVDRTSSPNMLFPSMEGEGLFQTRWYLKKNADLEYFMMRFAAGNLALVYATPDTVIDDVILLDASYIRIIEKEFFRADQVHYIPDAALDHHRETGISGP